MLTSTSAPLTILANIPLWVLPLGIGLLAIGLISSRTRRAPLAMYCALPFLGLLTVRATASLDASPAIWLVFLLSYALGAAVGRRAQRDYLIAREARHVRIKGEWLTMTTLMTIFALNFAKGLSQAIAPSFAASPGFTTGFAICAGLCAGVFLGRAWTTLRRQPNGAQASGIVSAA